MRLIVLPFACVFALAMTTPPAYALEDQNEKIGFSSNHAYLSSAEDNVDILNGNVTYAIPIYSVSPGSGISLNVGLVYNSKTWDLTDHNEDGTLDYDVVVQPNAKSEVGLGFQIRPGRIFGNNGNTFYEDESGALITLYTSDGSNYKSKDTTFLKAEKHASKWELWTPDGVKRTFAYHIADSDTAANENNKGWYLTRIDSADTLHWITFNYGDRTATRMCIYSAQDDLGRQVTFRSRTSYPDTAVESPEATIEGGYIDQVTYPTFGGGTSTCDLEYDRTEIEPPKDLVNFKKRGAGNVLLLTRVTCQPDVVYVFDYDTDGTNRGEVQSRTVPTGAQVSYEFETYVFKSSFNRGTKSSRTPSPPNITWTRRVKTRTVSGADVTTGVWRYFTSYLLDAYNDASVFHQEIQTGAVRVVDPYGNATVHRYHVSAQPLSVAFNGVEERTEWYEGDPMGGGLWRLVRAEDIVSEFDNPSSSGYFNDDERNIRTSRRIVTYLDAGATRPAKQTEWTNWDGRGHWREVHEFGLDPNYDGTMFSGPLYRVTETAYPDLAANDPLLTNWILNTYDYVATKNADGLCARYTKYQFDNYGRIQSTRGYVSLAVWPPAVSNGDVLLTLAFNSANGFPSSKTTSFGNGTNATCEAYDYDNGELSRASVCGSQWNKLRRDIDHGTGLVAADYDTANVKTAYTWDSLGRLTGIDLPNSEIDTVITYPSQVETRKTRIKASGSDFMEERYFYDTLGHLKQTSKRDADGTNSYMCWSYDAGGSRHIRIDMVA